MPRSVLNKSHEAQLDTLACNFAYQTVTRNLLDENGEIKLDQHKQPKSVTQLCGMLISRVDKQVWCSVTIGGDDVLAAFNAVMEKAKTTKRPYSTSAEMSSRAQEMEQRALRAEAELQRVRDGVAAGSIDPRPTTSQDKRKGSEKPETAKAEPIIKMG